MRIATNPANRARRQVVSVIVVIAIALVVVVTVWRRRSVPPANRGIAALSALPPRLEREPKSPLPVASRTPENDMTKAAPPPEPLADRGQIAHLASVDSWRNAGRGTVGAAIQSQFWAIAHGDTEFLQRTIMMDEAAKKALERLLEQVPANIRSQYSTAESFAAFLLASRPALKGYALSGQTTAGSDENSVQILTLLPGADRFKGEQQTFHRNTDGDWDRVIGPREISHWRDLIKWDEDLSRSRKWGVAK